MVHYDLTMKVLYFTLWLLFAAVGAQQRITFAAKVMVAGCIGSIVIYEGFAPPVAVDVPNGTMAVGKDVPFYTTSTYNASALPTVRSLSCARTAMLLTPRQFFRPEVPTVVSPPAPFCFPNESILITSLPSSYEYALSQGFTPLEDVDHTESARNPPAQPPLARRVFRSMRGSQMDLIEILTNWATQHAFDCVVQWFWARRYRIRRAVTNTAKRSRTSCMATTSSLYQVFKQCLVVGVTICLFPLVQYNLLYNYTFVEQLSDQKRQQELSEQNFRRIIKEQAASLEHNARERRMLREDNERLQSASSGLGQQVELLKTQYEETSLRLTAETSTSMRYKARLLAVSQNHSTDEPTPGFEAQPAPDTSSRRIRNRFTRYSRTQQPQRPPIARPPARDVYVQTEAHLTTQASTQTEIREIPTSVLESPTVAQYVTGSTQTDETVDPVGIEAQSTDVPSPKIDTSFTVLSPSAIEPKSSKTRAVGIPPATESDWMPTVAPQPLNCQNTQAHTLDVPSTAKEDCMPTYPPLPPSPVITKTPKKTMSRDTTKYTAVSTPNAPFEVVSEPAAVDVKLSSPLKAADLLQWRDYDNDLESDDDEMPTSALAAATVAAGSDPTNQQCEIVAAISPLMGSAFPKTCHVQDPAQKNTDSSLADQYIQALIDIADCTKQGPTESKFAYETHRPQLKELAIHIHPSREIQRVTTPIVELKPQLQQPATIDDSVVPQFDVTLISVAPDIRVTGTSVAPDLDLTEASAVPELGLAEGSGNWFSQSTIQPTLAESSDIPAALEDEMDTSLTGPALEVPAAAFIPAPSHIISSGSNIGPQGVANPIPGLDLSFSSIRLEAPTAAIKPDQEVEVAEDADEEDIYAMDTDQDIFGATVPDEVTTRIWNQMVDENYEDWMGESGDEDRGQPEIEEPTLEPSQAITIEEAPWHKSQSITRVHPPEYYQDEITEGPNLFEQAAARQAQGARESHMAHLAAKRMAEPDYREVDVQTRAPAPVNTINIRQSSSGLRQSSTEVILPDMPDVDAIIDSYQEQQSEPYESMDQTEQGPIPGLFMPQPARDSPLAHAVSRPGRDLERVLRTEEVRGTCGDSPRSPSDSGDSDDSESEYEPPPAGYVTATCDPHDGKQHLPLPPVLAYNPTTENDMQDAVDDEETAFLPTLNDTQHASTIQQMQDGANEAPFSPVVDVLQDTPSDDDTNDVMDDTSVNSDLTEIEEVEQRLEAHVGGMPAPRHAGRHTAVENGHFLRSINEMGGPHQPSAHERGLSRAMGVHAESRLQNDPKKPNLKRNCQSEDADDDDMGSDQHIKRIRHDEEDLLESSGQLVSEQRSQQSQQLLTPPLTSSANSTPAPESNVGQAYPAQTKKRSRDNEDEDEDDMEVDMGDRPAIKNIRFSTLGHGYGERVPRYQHVSEDTAADRPLQSWELAVMGIEERFTFSKPSLLPQVRYDFDNLPPMQDEEKRDDTDLDISHNVEEVFRDANGYEVLDSEDIARLSVLRDGWSTTSGTSAKFGHQGPAAINARIKEHEKQAALKHQSRLKGFNRPGNARWYQNFTGLTIEAAVIAKYGDEDKEEDKAKLMRTRGITEAPKNIVRKEKVSTDADTAWDFFNQAKHDEDDDMATS